MLKNSQSQANFGISQDFLVELGAVYRISCWTKSYHQLPLVTVESKKTRKRVTGIFGEFDSRAAWEYSTAVFRARETGVFQLGLLCGLKTNGWCAFKGITCSQILK